MLRIQFLGTPVISSADNPIVELTQAPVVLRLFAFLVMHRQQPQQRSLVAGTFWPDIAEERARRNLNNVFWRLRTLLPNADHFFVCDKQTIQFTLPADAWLDVVAFDQATQTRARLSANRPQTGQVTPACLAEFEQALALYRGDFLTGIDDEWCLMHRTQWRERYINTLEKFVEYCQTCGELARALPKVQHLVALEPYQESVHQHLIELYMGLERPSAARTQFEQYVQVWQKELNLSPSPHMIELAQQYGFRSSADAPIAAITALGGDLSALLQTHPAYLRHQLEICCKNDELYDLMADRQSQGENLSVAQALANQLNAPTAQIDILARRAWLATRQGVYAESLALAQTGLQLCDTTKENASRAWLHRLLGVASEEMGNFKASLHHYTKALAFDEAHHVAAFMPANLNNVAAAQLTLAHYCPAIQSLERAHALLVANAIPRVEVMMLGNWGYGWLKLGQLEQAGDYLPRALTLAQRIGDRGAEWWLAALVAKLYHARGETARALLFALQHYASARPIGDAWVLTYLAETLVLLYADGQDGEASLVWAQWMQEHAAQKRQWRYQVRSLLRLAQAQHLLGQRAAAFCAIRQAVAQYSNKQQTLEEEPELFATYAQCAAAVDQPQISAEAQQKAQQALHAQMVEIPDPTLRQSFLCVQHLPYELLRGFQT